MRVCYMNNIKHGLLWIACLLGVEAVAQGFSPAAMEQMKRNRLWAASWNAAGMAVDSRNNYSHVTAGYQLKDGDFCRPQEGQKETVLGVSSEGFLNLENALVWGAFHFLQKNMTDAGYNASIADPFRGMPYYVVDSHLSKWRNQYYDLEFKASTPLLKNHWAIGIGGGYQATLAAKQRDPRVDTRFYHLRLTPSVVYQLNEKHTFGVSLKYTSIKEDSRMSNVNQYVDQDYYQLYGLGTAIKGIGSGVTSNYVGDSWGGAVQYNVAVGNFDVLLEGSYDVRAETVEQSFTNPKKIAGVKDKVARVHVTANHTGHVFGNFLRLTYQHGHMDGIQYVSQRDNSATQQGWMDLHKHIRSTYQLQTASLSYILSKLKGMEYKWQLEAGVTYTRQEDTYLIPRSVQNAENIMYLLRGKENIALGSRLNRRLLIDLHVAYNQNLSGIYSYGGTYADYLTVTELQQGLTNYYTSDFCSFGGALTYSQQIQAHKSMNLFGKISFDRIATSDYDFKGRSYWAVSLGCNF